MVNVFMATAVDIGEPRTPAGGPHVRDKQDVGKRLALAFRDNFIAGRSCAICPEYCVLCAAYWMCDCGLGIAGDGPFYTPGAVAASASSSAQTGGHDVAVLFSNLPPGARS